MRPLHRHRVGQPAPRPGEERRPGRGCRGTAPAPRRGRSAATSQPRQRAQVEEPRQHPHVEQDRLGVARDHHQPGDEARPAALPRQPARRRPPRRRLGLARPAAPPSRPGSPPRRSAAPSEPGPDPGHRPDAEERQQRPDHVAHRRPRPPAAPPPRTPPVAARAISAATTGPGVATSSASAPA